MSFDSQGSSFNFNSLMKTLMPRMQSGENDIKSVLSSMGSNPSAGDLIQVQAKVQQWSLVSSLNSNLVKELGDTLKSIVQKAA